MQLGAFSLSLAVKDIAASRTFYEKLGFAAIAGRQEQNWLILRNDEGLTLGLFQGMFERNSLTFNPGWDAACANVEPFSDVRELQAQIEAAGLKLATRVDAGKPSGPAWFSLVDPDGNPILIDQHR